MINEINKTNENLNCEIEKIRQLHSEIYYILYYSYNKNSIIFKRSDIKNIINNITEMRNIYYTDKKIC